MIQIFFFCIVFTCRTVMIIWFPLLDYCGQNVHTCEMTDIYIYIRLGKRYINTFECVKLSDKFFVLSCFLVFLAVELHERRNLTIVQKTVFFNFMSWDQVTILQYHRFSVKIMLAFDLIYFNIMSTLIYDTKFTAEPSSMKGKVEKFLNCFLISTV